jgi:hypothetical protein
MSANVLDPIPLWALFLLFAIAALAAYEIGFRFGRWWQARMPGEQEGPTGVLIGSVLGLMAFLLAVTMGMASDRFDTRRGAVLAEANAVEAAYLQTAYLSAAAAGDLRGLLREYLPLRIATDDPAGVGADIEQSLDLMEAMWVVMAEEARTTTNPDLVAAFGDSLTEVVNIGQSRVTAGIYARVPYTVLILLLSGSVLSLAMTGYGAGIGGQRSVLSSVVLVIALGAVLMLVIDLDRPQEGLIRVSQQPLIDVAQRLGVLS